MKKEIIRKRDFTSHVPRLISKRRINNPSLPSVSPTKFLKDSIVINFANRRSNLKSQCFIESQIKLHLYSN